MSDGSNSALKHWYEHYRGERTVEGRALREYVRRMRVHFSEAARVLKPGGVAVYAVANSIRAGKSFDLVDGPREMLLEAGWCDVDVRSRGISDRRILPVGRDAHSGRFSSTAGPGISESLIYARKPPAT